MRRAWLALDGGRCRVGERLRCRRRRASFPTASRAAISARGAGDCSFSSLAQCQATASGRDASCAANPYFNAKADMQTDRSRQSRKEILMRILALAILAIGAASAAAPAQAQTYDPNYPVCLHVYGPDQLLRMYLYLPASMQRVGLGPLGAMRDQSVFRTCISRAVGTPLQAAPQRLLSVICLRRF